MVDKSKYHKVNKLKTLTNIKHLGIIKLSMKEYLKNIKKSKYSYVYDYHIKKDLAKITNEINNLTKQLDCKHINTSEIIHENHHNGDDTLEIICDNCKFSLYYC